MLFWWTVVYEAFFKACDMPFKNIKYLTFSKRHMNFFSYLDMFVITIYSYLRTTMVFSNLL